MFKKVLVAEDFDTMNVSVSQVLEELAVPEIIHANACDDAFLKIKRAIHDLRPYDLLISELSFLNDESKCTITSGEELIAAVKKLQPDIKVIAFAVEDKSFKIRSLFENSGISAYVYKGRNSMSQLKNALSTIFASEERYLSPELDHIRKDNSVTDIDSYDVQLLQLLAKGLKQEEIAWQLRELGITPNSTSAVEKRINRLKIYFMSSNTVQLVVTAKDVGIL